METVVLNITGMTCGGCVRSVENVLRGVEGVRAVRVSLEQGSATVECDDGKANLAAFKTAIEEAGYEVPA
jgi:copper chaperone